MLRPGKEGFLLWVKDDCDQVSLSACIYRPTWIFLGCTGTLGRLSRDEDEIGASLGAGFRIAGRPFIVRTSKIVVDPCRCSSLLGLAIAHDWSCPLSKLGVWRPTAQCGV